MPIGLKSDATEKCKRKGNKIFLGSGQRTQSRAWGKLMGRQIHILELRFKIFESSINGAPAHS